MGTSGSVLTTNANPSQVGDKGDIGDNEESTSISFVEWKVFPSQSEAIKKFLIDGTLKRNYDNDQLELRALLDEPVAQQELGKFAAAVDATTYLACWCDIQEYKSISADSYRRSTALYIMDTYLVPKSPSFLNLSSPLESKHLRALIDASESDPARLKPCFYNDIQFLCFCSMVHKVYKPFKQTTDFETLNDTLKHKYNNVRLSHFKYFSKVGEGGFGFVVKCKKISTGKFYAMKIQPKNILLKHSKAAPHKVSMEKNTMAACRHPFIVSLAYAFQTEGLVILVVELSLVDLHHYQTFSPGGHLREDHVRFYAAEIVLALAYMHQMGLIYRDLKPQNVLLHEDGHIRLIDLGCVMDVKGRYTYSIKSLSTDEGDEHHHNQINYQARMPYVAVLAASVTYDPGDDISPYSLSLAAAGERSNSMISASRSYNSRSRNSHSPIMDRLQEDDDVEADDPDEVHLMAAQKPHTPTAHGKQNKCVDLNTGHSISAPVQAKQDEHGGDASLCNRLSESLKKQSEHAEYRPEQQQPTVQQPITSPAAAEAAYNAAAAADEAEKKKISVMGTLGYMPPEMVIMLNQKKTGPGELFGNDLFNPDNPVPFLPMEERKHTLLRRQQPYGNSVDWWGLGVTMYKLLTGTRPFPKDEFDEYVDIPEELEPILKENMYCTEFRRLFQVVEYPEYLSTEAIDLLRRLMDVSEKTRLGAGRRGLKDLKNHPFFKTIDWDRLEQKQVEPPFVPKRSAVGSAAATEDEEYGMVAYPDLRTLLAEHGRWGWTEEVCDSDMQKYFSHWDYIAPHTLREEAGLAEQRNKITPKSSRQQATRAKRRGSKNNQAENLRSAETATAATGQASTRNSRTRSREQKGGSNKRSLLPSFFPRFKAKD